MNFPGGWLSSRLEILERAKENVVGNACLMVIVELNYQMC